jgi:hypothetical protein
VAPVPLDDRVHVYRVRMRSKAPLAGTRPRRHVSYACGVGVARPEFTAFTGAGWNEETEAVGVYAGGACYVGSGVSHGSFFFESRALSSLSAKAANCVHEVRVAARAMRCLGATHTSAGQIHVRMREGKSGAVHACVRIAILDAKLFADGAAPPMDYSVRQPTPDGARRVRAARRGAAGRACAVT